MDKNKYKTPLAEAIHAKGFRQNWIANKLSVMPETVSRWTNGHSRPSALRQQKLADLLGKQIEEIFPKPIKNDK